jgi:hypothetical protein
MAGCLQKGALAPDARSAPPQAEPSAAAPVVLDELRVEPPAVPAVDVETRRVSTSTGLGCQAYLRIPAGATRLAIVASGTGTYSTTQGDMGPLARMAGRAGVALLTVDKPGISFDGKGQLRVIADVFRRHTLADLVECGRLAASWALTRMPDDARLVLHGHSEGAQVMVRVLGEAGAEPALLSRTELVVLTGLPLEPVVSGAARQVALFMPRELSAFVHARKTHDDDWLMRLAMPSAYFDHPTAREHLEPLFDAIAAARPGLRVELFHGEGDRNAPIALVRKLVSHNAAARAHGKPALDLRLHAYVDARHSLDERFDHDMEDLVASLPRTGPE